MPPCTHTHRCSHVYTNNIRAAPPPPQCPPSNRSPFALLLPALAGYTAPRGFPSPVARTPCTRGRAGCGRCRLTHATPSAHG
jgi:hypothetical protein